MTFEIPMVLILFVPLLALFLVVVSVVWHIGYTEYKEREWKKNNPDEFDLLKRPHKGRN
jgi:hypothetical protein